MYFFSLILAAPMLFFWSLAVLLTPFGWLRVFPLVAAAIGAFFFWRRDHRLATGLGAWAALTYLLDLLVWWSSRGPIEPGRGKLTWVGLQSDGLAGFPWHALELPPGAMGADQPTAEQWAVVMTNLGFWGIVAVAVVVTMLPRQRWQNMKPSAAPWIFLGAAFVFNQLLSVTFMLWFD